MVEQIRLLAGYNQWMNERLFDACASLTDAQRKQDRGAFFRSIHGTLNHILLADRIWMARFLGETFPVRSLDQELYPDFEALRAARREMDEKICAWASALTSEKLDAELRYTSVSAPAPKRFPLRIAALHFFNHQTHHRGQATTLLSQCGVDVGVTDLIQFAESA